MSVSCGALLAVPPDAPVSLAFFGAVFPPHPVRSAAIIRAARSAERSFFMVILLFFFIFLYLFGDDSRAYRLRILDHTSSLTGIPFALFSLRTLTSRSPG